MVTRHRPPCDQIACTARGIHADLSRREFLGNCATLIALSRLRLDPSQSTGLAEARHFLREEQAAAAKGAIGFPYAGFENVTAQSLSRLRDQRQFVSTSDEKIVRRGVFRFDRVSEEERVRRAEELIQRVDPGPFEDPGYFAILAYEATSLEMAMPKLKEQFSRFLLGTVHEATVNAFSRQFALTGYTVVLLNSGFIDLVYQSAKAVVEALHPVWSEDSRFLVRTTVDLETC